MSKNSRQLYELTDTELGKRVGQGTYPEAQSAWDRAREIRGEGGSPAMFYSEFNGFVVIDENDIKNTRHLLSLRSHAKKYPG